jgi:hypothetical protein
MLKFHLRRVFHVDGLVAAIQVDNNGYSDSCFRSGDRNDKQGKEDTIQPVRVEVFVESDKIDIHAVQDQFDGHEHTDQVTAGEQAKDADKEKRRAYE